MPHPSDRARESWSWPLLLLGLLASSHGDVTRADSPPEPALVFEARHAAFGDRYQRETVEHRYRFVNGGDRVVRVTETVDVRGSGDVSASPRLILPGGAGEVRVRQPLGDHLGQTAFRYAILTDEGGGRRYRVTLSGFVQCAYEPEAPLVDFGQVDRASGASGGFALSSREVDRLELAGVTALQPFLGVRVRGRTGVAGEGLDVEVDLRPQAPEGYQLGTFDLRTNVPHQREIRVTWRANVVGVVVPDENPVNLGMTELGSPSVIPVRFRSRTGQPFELARAASDDPSIDLALVDCEPAPAAPCGQVDIHVRAEKRGGITGAFRVWIAGQEEPITLRYRGIVVAPGTEVRDFEPPDSEFPWESEP